MTKAIQAVKHFLAAEDGPTAVEYAVLLGLIIIGSIVIIGTLGGQVLNIFTNASTEVANVPGA